MHAKIYITPKQTVLDPQGKAIVQSLHSLGYSEVHDARMGKYLEIRLVGLRSEDARSRIDEMCRRLLANPVIEDVRFDIVEE